MNIINGFPFVLLVLVVARCTSARAAAAQPAGGTAQALNRAIAMKHRLQTPDAGASTRIQSLSSPGTPPAPRSHSSMAEQQLPSGAPAASLQDAPHTNLHMKRRLVVTTAIHPIQPSVTNTANFTTPAGSMAQQQESPQYSLIRLKAHLTTLTNLQPGSPSSSQQISRDRSLTTAAARYIYNVSTAATRPLQLALLLSLPFTNTSTSSGSSAACAAVHQAPILLTVHIQQRLGGRAYLWTDSQVIVPGTAVASIQANMSKFSYAWALKQRQQATAAAAQMTASHNTTAPAAATEHLAVIPVSSGSMPAASNETNTTDSTENINQQQVYSNDDAGTGQQHGPSAAAASICPVLQQHLTACAAANAASTAYAVAGLFDRQPAHAAWIAAVLTQNNAPNDWLPSQLQQQLAAGSQQAMDSMLHTSTDALYDHVCPAWPAVFDLQQLSASPVSYVTAAAPSAAHVAAQQDDSNIGNALWATVAPYLELHVAYDSESHSVTFHAPFEHVWAGLGILLLATAVVAALSCRRSSSKRQKTAAAATPAAAAVFAAATHPRLDQSQHSQQGADASVQGYNTKRQSSRRSKRDQGFDDAGGFALFGRSALHQLDQQQQLNSLADVEADDDLFGYEGAAAAAPAVTAATQGPATTAAVVNAVRKASAKAATALKAAIGAKHPAGNTASLFSPNNGAVRGHNGSTAAAAAAPNTAAKLAAGYWDSADEEAVNQLPANIQEHLQAGGRWQREAGGRLMRGSLKALRAASNMAAAAVTAALSGSKVAGVAGQQQGDDVWGRSGVGSGSKDADLLKRLVAAGPGTELALSDEDD